jgi:hypothetical protein
MLVDEIDLIPSSGFSLESFFRGFLGIFSVLFLLIQTNLSCCPY